MNPISDILNEVIMDLDAAITTCAVISEFYDDQDCGKVFLSLQHVIEAAKTRLEAAESIK